MDMLGRPWCDTHGFASSRQISSRENVSGTQYRSLSFLFFLAYQIAEEGSLNILRQAEKAGVTKVVVTSSFVAIRNPRGTWNNDDWNPTTKEEALQSGNPIAIYTVAKTFAEKAVWDWATRHPHVEITTLCTPMILGPLTAQYFLLPEPDFDALVTDIAMFNLIAPHGAFHWNNFQVDIRDIARAHVLALESPATRLVGRKRLAFASPHSASWGQAVEYIAEKRPELRGRLITGTPPSRIPDRLPLDFKRIEEVLGMKISDFHSWEQTVLDAIDSLVQLEKIWTDRGHSVEIPGFKFDPRRTQ